MSIPKDIAHPFVDKNERETQTVNPQCFTHEDDYLKTHESNFVFVVYTAG